MRIGIYTLPLRYNYGGILQAFALQEVLRRMGHEVVTFLPYPYMCLKWQQKPYVYSKRIIKKLLGFPSCIHLEEKINSEHHIKMQNLQPFISNNIKTLSYKEFCELNSSDFDALIVGSDQVWRPSYNEPYGRTIENAFLDFAKDWHVIKIAYAASFGTDKWEFSRIQTRRCSELAKRLDAIGVRENTAVHLCEKYLDVESVHVLDPTLLLSFKDYERLIGCGQPSKKPKGNLLCYILDEKQDAVQLIKRISDERNLIPFRANSFVENVMAPIEEQIQPPIEQWLRNFIESDFVITDSFHGSVFSIIFKKPFIVLGNKNRGNSRFSSLLGLFSLESHYITSVKDYNASISYEVPEKVYDILNIWQEKSLSFLEKALR